MRKSLVLPLLAGIFLLFANSCQQHKNADFGKLSLNFAPSIKTDTFAYVNQAGNKFMVSEIQFFISDIKLFKKGGNTIDVDKYEDIHYFDTDIPETWDYNLVDSIPSGTYHGISFTFGINEQKNLSMKFVNPPESFMFWPRYLGGGYHYMKMNGKWIDSIGEQRVFNFHLGIGQEYDEDKKVKSFIQNYFEVKIPEQIIIKSGKITEGKLVMLVENWFKNPNTWDFDVIGGKIMQNQKAMKMACENGKDVFTIKDINYKNL